MQLSSKVAQAMFIGCSSLDGQTSFSTLTAKTVRSSCIGESSENIVGLAWLV